MKKILTLTTAALMIAAVALAHNGDKKCGKKCSDKDKAKKECCSKGAKEKKECCAKKTKEVKA